MAKEDLLYVYLNEELVGQLIRKTTGAIIFEYEKNWLENDNAIPISLSLPLDKKEYKGPEVYNFFDNLLPDDKGIRVRIAKNRQASSDEPFDLLAAIGEDCVGALRFVGKKSSKPSTKILAKNLSTKDIANTLKGLKIFLWVCKGRMAKAFVYQWLVLKKK